MLPADVHAALTAQCGRRGLTAALTEALGQLVAAGEVARLDRPGRDRGTVEVTLRLPVAVADAADAWCSAQGLSRQAAVEYAAITALGLAALMNPRDVAVRHNSASLAFVGPQSEGLSHDH